MNKAQRKTIANKLRYLKLPTVLKDFPEGSEGYKGVVAAFKWVGLNGTVACLGADHESIDFQHWQGRGRNQPNCVVLRDNKFAEVKKLFPDVYD